MNLSGRQMKSCNFIKISKAQKFKKLGRSSINKIVYHFARLGFGIAEYNDRPIIEKEKIGGGESIVPDLSEKIMACMVCIYQPVSRTSFVFFCTIK